jgi:hypothetical protein
MVRRFAEPVYVRPAAGPSEGRAEGSVGGAPEAFVWRDRLYVVREVLAHWRERTAWWTAGAARAVHGDLEPATEVLATRDAEPAADPRAAATRSAAIGQERQVWRVEASPGRAHGHGVYDLCHDLFVDPDWPARSGLPDRADPDDGAWRLLRVAD